MSRYTPDELEQWWFAPTIAVPAAPTAAEINAGEEITEAIITVSGFKYTGTKVETPDLKTRFNRSVPGRFTAEDSSIQFYKGDEATDVERVVEDLLADGTEGFVVRIPPEDNAPQPIAASTTCAVWPVTVMSNSEDPPVAGEIAKFTVDFSIPDPPEKNAVVAT
jgi:hypothetical protein